MLLQDVSKVNEMRLCGDASEVFLREMLNVVWKIWKRLTNSVVANR